MKIILLRDVARIGRRNTIVEVPDGYAQNQLIPKKLAIAATPANLKKIEAQQAGVAALKDAKSEAFLKAVAALEASPLQIVADANEQGHLFKAIHPADIVVAASAQGIALESSSVIITEQIKSLGEHVITLTHGQHRISYRITINKK